LIRSYYHPALRLRALHEVTEWQLERLCQPSKGEERGVATAPLELTDEPGAHACFAAEAFHGQPLAQSRRSER
jgi:hypothetical protein